MVVNKTGEANINQEIKDMFDVQAATLKKKFTSRRINFYSCQTIFEAKEKVLDLVNLFKNQDSETSIGFGDSVTLHQIDIFNEIKLIENLKIINPMSRSEDGKYVIFGDLPPGKLDIPKDEYYDLMNKLWDSMREALLTDVFIIGANAITMNGQIVSTDGTGNRIGGMIFGPRKVIVVVGRNKLCKDLESAIERNRNIAAPLNYFRHNNKHHNRFDNPCMKLGYCTECNSARRGCLKTVIIDGEMEGFKDRLHLIYVNEDLGL